MHDAVCESTPWCGERSLVLVCMMALYFIVPEEYIQQGKDSMLGTSVDHLIGEWS
jgi:hypothetical protein